MKTRFVGILITVAAVVMGMASFADAAKVVARVDGDPITDEELKYVAVVALGVEEKEVTQDDMKKALRQAVVNHKVWLEVSKNDGGMLQEVERAADMMVARNYFLAWMADYGQVEAMKTVTPTKIAESLPLPEPLAFLFAIVMESREKLEEVREEILADKITFEEAAKKYSKGISAKNGGMVGGIKPGDDRFSENARKEIFSAPIGTVTGVYDELLGYTIYLVKDRKTPEELRLANAHESLEDKIRAEMNRLGWEASTKRATQTGSVLYINDSNAAEFEGSLDKPIMKVGNREYLVRDLMSRSGGKSHGKKDLLTIAENVFRDLMLEGVYVEAKGSREQLALRKKAMIEHFSTRRYLADRSKDLVIADSEITDYIEKNRNKFDLPDRVDLGLIMVKSEQRRDVVLDRLNSETFEVVAQAWTQSKKYPNGKVGVVPLSQVAGDKSQIKAGMVLPPKKMGDGDDEGWYILKVLQFFPAEPASLKNLSPQQIGGIRSILLSRKKEDRLLGLVEGVMKGAKTEILL